MIDYKKARKFGSLELLAKQVVEGFITGLHKSPYHGFSVEFAEHRLYNNGESTKHIDWKLYAKTDKLFIKKYEEETNLRCHFLIDASSSMLFPNNQPYNKLSFSIDATAALIYLMRGQRDAFGVSLFSDEMDFYAPAKSSLPHQRYIFSHLEKSLQEKYTLDQKKGTAISKILDRSALLLKKRSLVILFTDFMGLDNLNDLNNSIRHLKFNQHEVVVFHVQHDSFENQFDLKNRYYHVVDMETGEKLKLHPREIKEVYQTRRESHIKQLNDLLIQHQIDVIDVNIEDGFEDVLLQYLVKRKKIN